MKRNCFGYGISSAWGTLNGVKPNLLKSGLLSVAAIAAIWGMQPQAAEAVSLTFSPVGSNLADGDSIRDLKVTPGQDLLFTVKLAVNSLADTETLKEVSYFWDFDSTELTFQGFTAAGAGTSTCHSAAPSLVCGAAEFNHVVIDNLAWGEGNYTVGQIAFKVTNDLSKLISNGKYDFATKLFWAYSSSDEDLMDGYSSQNSSVRTVEVQAEAIPTPALLPGLIGLGASAYRKRKHAKHTAA